MTWTLFFQLIVLILLVSICTMTIVKTFQKREDQPRRGVRKPPSSFDV